MRALSSAVVLAVVLLVAAMLASAISARPEASAPVAYIIGIDGFDTIGGERMYLLSYTVDGKHQTPVFHSMRDVRAFVAHLSRVTCIENYAEL
jgi:hypothetical protein